MKFVDRRDTAPAGEIAFGNAAWIDGHLYQRVRVTDLDVSVIGHNLWSKDKLKEFQRFISDIDSGLALFANIGAGGMRLVKKDSPVVSEPLATYSVEDGPGASLSARGE